MPTVRVLLLASEAPPVVSGIARFVDRVADGLRANGHQVDILSSADIPRWTRGEVRLSSFALKWPSFARRLPEYDAVHVIGPVPTLTDAFLLLVRGLGNVRRPAIAYTHICAVDLPGLGWACDVYGRLHRRLAGSADRIVAATEAYRSELGRIGAPVDLIPWGVETDAFRTGQRARRTAGDPLRVMFVGQMRPYKGVPHLLEAVAGHEELSVTLVGGGGLLDDYRALAERLHATNATFAGRVPDEALRMLYAQHDVIVLPSTTRAEAFGLVLLEGMSAGCVPVASDLPGVREVAGPTGLLVPPNDPAALREALLQLARDPERLADLSTRSMERSEQFDWRYTVAAYETLTQEMVEKVQARRARVLGGRWGDDPVPVLADVRDAFGASWASLMLFDSPRSRLALRAAWGSGVSAELLRRHEPRIARYVAGVQRPTLIDAATVAPLAGMLERPEVGSAMSLPIRSRGGVIGVLNLAMAAEAPQRFSAVDLRRLARYVS
ncbi:MAG TPA: glycosyltransferase [Candidatus Limnocylindrales bacterium]|nr:glycosyltransferase [Candidatus Limnocylindrales bacterium]